MRSNIVAICWSCSSRIRSERYPLPIGTVLFVYAHPDDESFVSGTPMKLAAAGHTVALLTLTRGDAGLWFGRDLGSWERPELGAERAKEWAAAVESVGFGWSRLLRYPDGGLKDAPAEVITADIVGAIREVGPEVVCTFGPEGAGSEHDDHRSVSFFAARGFARAALADQYPERGDPHVAGRLFFSATPYVADAPAAFGALTPTHSIDVSEFEARKLAAFECHRTQFKDRQLFLDVLARRQGKEYFHLAIDRTGATTRSDDLFG
jgi:LmbE family N-acetylglucosaminyl deacetylase